jgi:hypothetical protein
MCEAIIYPMSGKIGKIYFSHSNAKLPVKCLNGEVEFITWGRREHEAGSLPIGGWANHKALRQGRWDKFFPINVKILAHEFMLKDLSTGLSNWYSLNDTQFIHGIIARDGQEQRLYIVTIQRELSSFDGAWPRILTMP